MNMRLTVNLSLQLASWTYVIFGLFFAKIEIV